MAKLERIELPDYRLRATGEKTSPLPGQAWLHSTPALYLAWMDAYGCGKTLALCKQGLIRSFDGPHNYGVLARAKLKDVKATTMEVFWEEAIPQELKRKTKWRKTECEFTLPNGSAIRFMGMDEPEDFESLNLGWMGVDQAEAPACEWGFHKLRFRVRRDVGPNQLRQRIAVGNPKGKGNWVHRLWSRHASDPNWKMIGGHGTTSNPYLPDDYLESLLDMESDEAVRLVGGEWAGAEGPILENWNGEIHVISHFQPPEEWLKVRSIDTGLTHRTACIWGALDEETNTVYIYQEHMGENVELAGNCRDIIDLTMRDDIAYTVVDPAALTRDPVNQLSIFDQMVSHGIHPLTIANNDVHGSIAHLRNLLAYKVNRFHQVTEAPHIFVMDNCPETAAQLEEWQWEIKRGQATGKPLKQNDDFVDCTRYLVMGLGQITEDMTTEPSLSEHQECLAHVLEQVEQRKAMGNRVYQHQFNPSIQPEQDMWRGRAWL